MSSILLSKPSLILFANYKHLQRSLPLPILMSERSLYATILLGGEIEHLQTVLGTVHM